MNLFRWLRPRRDEIVNPPPERISPPPFFPLVHKRLRAYACLTTPDRLRDLGPRQFCWVLFKRDAKGNYDYTIDRTLNLELHEDAIAQRKRRWMPVSATVTFFAKKHGYEIVMGMGERYVLTPVDTVQVNGTKVD